MKKLLCFLLLSAALTGTTPARAETGAAVPPAPAVRAGSAYMNLSFDVVTDAGWSTTGDVSGLQLGDHDPQQRGFSLRNAELALDGAVDPYFKGFANIALKLDEANETGIELEEAYLLSTALPANLQVKVGQFFAEFGRQNPQHPHAWAFVDEPLVMGRLLGGDGLRNVGARLSWLAPTPWYLEAFLGVFNGEGGTAFSFRNLNDGAPLYGRTPIDRQLSGPDDLLIVPRMVSSFDLTDTQTLVLGASAALGPNNTGADARTQIYGADVYWKWKPSDAHGGFPFLSWQTEAMVRRMDVGAAEGLSAGAMTDWGFYSQVVWGFTEGWAAGLRGDYVSAGNRDLDPNDPLRADRTRISPNLTWYLTEFSKLRVQYNYDHGQAFGDEHSVWFQMEFMLGAHAAHKF